MQLSMSRLYMKTTALTLTKFEQLLEIDILTALMFSIYPGTVISNCQDIRNRCDLLF